MSPASLSEIPHDQAQGRGRPGVRLPHLREALREGPQPQRAHVYGAPADSGGGSERRRRRRRRLPAAAAAAAAVRPAGRRGPPGPGKVTAEERGGVLGFDFQYI